VRVPEFDADPRRRRPYIWPSWLTKLLAGEDRCWWKVWYKTNHRYAKRPDDPERAEFFAQYNQLHDAITNERAFKLRAAGWEVKLEEEAEFKLNGKDADVQGKPDLVAMKGAEAIVSDSKSGKRRDSDHWQVLIYMFALPLSWLKKFVADGGVLRGEVVYKDGHVVPVRALGTLERERIVAAIRSVSGSRVPDASPSAQECRFCDLVRCPVRYSAPEGDATAYF
jgi:hypothetical protein